MSGAAAMLGVAATRLGAAGPDPGAPVGALLGALVGAGARERGLGVLLAASAALLGWQVLRVGWRALASGLIGKELRHLFLAPIAWLFLAGFALVNGFVLLFLVEAYQGRPNEPVAQALFGAGNAYFWILQLVVIPAITMRLVAEERAAGTLETLLTAPVGPAEVVTAKFIAAWCFYVALWLPSAALLAAVFQHAAPDGFAAALWATRAEPGLVARVWGASCEVMDLGPIVAAYAGTWLMGGAWLSVSLCAASFPRSQGVAFIAGFVAVLALFAVGFLEVLIRDDPGWLPGLRQALRFLSFPSAFEGFPRGLVDTRALAYFSSWIGLGLFLAGRVVGSPRWR